MERKPLPIKLNQQALTFSFGKAEFNAFTRLKSPKSSYFHLNEILYGSNMVKHDRKAFYKEFTQELDITPSAAVKVINNLGWKLIAGDFTSEQIFKWCYPRGAKRQLNQTKVITLHRMKEVIKQALADGQENLIPFILSTCATPKEIKDLVGRSTWKKIIHNSFTLNNKISKYFCHKQSLTQVSRLVDCSSSIIEHFGSGNETYCEILNVVNKICKEQRILTKYEKCKSVYDLVKDTIELGGEIGYPVNLQWSYKRFKEEHDIVVRKYREKDYSSKIITEGIYKKLPLEYQFEDNKATLLRSALDIAVEGSSMGHCVAGYAGRSATGQYVVYHLVLNDGTEGTLGCTVLTSSDNAEHKVLSYQQCYGKYNKRIDNTFAKQLIEHINSKINQEKI